MDLGLKNRIAVVQSSSRGLGFGTASALSMEGAFVVICSRNEAGVVSAAKRIESMSRVKVLPVCCDVTTEAGRNSLFSACRNTYGEPDILVTNAGGPPPGNPLSFVEKDYKSALDNNFLSAVNSVKAILPDMLDRGWGRIIMITSAAVKQPVQNLILSNSARSALTAYAKTIANEVAGSGITVNTVLPGVHNTDRVQSLVETMAVKEGRKKEEVWEEWQSRVPVGRLGTIDEFGSLVTYLCSDKAGFITGQAIVHDGGATLGLL